MGRLVRFVRRESSRRGHAMIRPRDHFAGLLTAANDNRPARPRHLTARPRHLTGRESILIAVACLTALAVMIFVVEPAMTAHNATRLEAAE